MKKAAVKVVDLACHTSIARLVSKLYLALTQYRIYSAATVSSMNFDLLRLKARSNRGQKREPPQSKLHFGCGSRFVDGWHNVDVAGSQQDVDLASGCLPWPESCFEAMVSQHVIEHLELKSELLPLLKELRRVARNNAELWVSCPDMEKVCSSYMRDRGADLLADRDQRFSSPSGLENIPPQQYINFLFIQSGEHKNLFDFELLSWVLGEAGFVNCQRVDEDAFLERFPEFPRRNDDAQSIYVKALATEDGLALK